MNKMMTMIQVQKPLICHLSPTSIFLQDSQKGQFFKSKKLLATKSSSKCCCCCIKNEETKKALMGFSLLESDTTCDSLTVWSTMAFYIFSLHIPFSFGGLSTVANVLHLQVLDPQTQVLSLITIEALELIGFLLLLRFSGKHHLKLLDCFKPKKLPKERNWLLASIFGFGFLVIMVFLTSLLADQLVGPKNVNNPVLKDILSSGSISATACILTYCIVIPVLEESVYRGFLLTSLSSTMKWKQAVAVSSLVFSATHFSGENFLQLFIVGIVLGSSYCWTGNLSSSFAIHSLYNALILYLTYIS